MTADIGPGNDSVHITRIFRAPRAEVFGWWASAEKLQQWSRCRDAVSCEVVMDFRVGGSFTQKMTIAIEGRNCQFTVTGVYEEIVVPERITYRLGPGAPMTRVTVDFFDHADGTRVELTHEGFVDGRACRAVQQGTGESLDILESIVAARAAATSGAGAQ